MSRSAAGSTREAEALTEIGRTLVHTAGTHFLTGAFLLILLAGSALELAAAAAGKPNLLRGEAVLDLPHAVELAALWRTQGAFAMTGRMRDAGVAVQDRLDRNSQLAETVRPPLQGLVARTLRYGNSQVLIGADDWLFFRDDFEHLTGPPFLAPAALARRAGGLTRPPSSTPHPLPAILGLAEDLRARGIGFVVMPVPTKLGVAWERFLGRRERGGPALSNSSQGEFLTRLRAAGVEVFDPTPILRSMELQGENPYMQFDSHWSPAGFDRVAAALAKSLRGRFELGEPVRYHRQTRPFERRADLGGLLGLAPANNRYRLEQLQIQVVDGPGHRPFISRKRGGRVLLVGDSFSRLLIRHRRQRGDANFAAQLAFHLETQVDILAENDAGADFALRMDWLRRPQALDGRQVVVLEVAERAFSLGDWTTERLPAAPTREAM